MMSGDNLQRVIDALSDGVYITDGHGVTVTVNKAYERITRIPRSALVGLHMSEVVQRGYISRSVSLEVLKEQGPVTLTQTIGNDHKILVSGTPMFDPQGRIEYIVTTVRDVTELLQAKRAEEQLEQILHVRDHYGAHEANDAVIISRATQRCYDLAKRVAPTAAKVLIQGETGTGKTLLARTIHDYSAVAQGPFIELNCAAMPESLLEAELFGYVPGAFTGAAQKGKTGLLEAANNGTLFLDEIGDLPLSLQAKLLKVIAENRFIPVGGIQFKNTNFRLISATHHNLHELVAQRQFREDLLYRLSVVPLELPPLRERAEEVEALLQHYLSHFNAKYEFDCRWHSDVIARLQRYHWPGNIRELINLTERLVVTAEQSLITTGQLPREMRVDTGFTALGMSLKEQVEGLERELIEQALAMYGTTRQAAAALGIDQSTLVKKQQRWRAQQAVENRNTVEFKDV
ncbi:PAS domain-containing protein [Pseudidiomarina gelatinasegens]|uniref:HTH-type transcriptional regulatory protein TyrR n=1 Tax=Pseudidiomarina gelatinasegens TaxID=2487740 RepID=A0A443YZ83_9GAMM|nr:sigma 54-interacting transcriptional regulator [Pseudidiomarina gelatinasegens]RWU09462.1 PAS domain-containing protein [Pseudidiomarina gelatinasegens]